MVRIQEFYPPLISEVEMTDFVEMPQGLIVGKNTERDQEEVHLETLDPLSDHPCLKFQDSPVALVWKSDPEEGCIAANRAASLLLFECGTGPVSASVYPIPALTGCHEIVEFQCLYTDIFMVFRATRVRA